MIKKKVFAKPNHADQASLTAPTINLDSSVEYVCVHLVIYGHKSLVINLYGVPYVSAVRESVSIASSSLAN